ncbi:MAG: (2Fe-2S) ferredoxin domain-containing protein [Planctomycetes bacterium]|nr:(2Fe-2S) ferredoxin domain-containing protein [Planctomycetota bacterium]
MTAPLTVEGLRQLKARLRAEGKAREEAIRARVTVHMGTCGIAAGAREVLEAVEACVREEAATDVWVTTSGCAGLCSREPMMTVERRGSPGAMYAGLDAKKAREVFASHALGGKIAEAHLLCIGSERTD